MRVHRLRTAATAAIVAALVSAPAAADPLLLVSFDEPTGRASIDEAIDVRLTVEVAPGSDTL